MSHDTQTLSVTDFLLARIAEDETIAQAAQGSADHGWFPAAIGDATGGLLDAREDEHIARHDPARVMAECEAKRRIVEMGQFSDSEESAVDFWLAEGKGRTPPQPLGTMVSVFRLLALPYADHPDYREEWKP